MSNLSQHVEQNCQYSQGCGALKLILKPYEQELGGFSVRRILPTKPRKMVGPWVFFDHMGPTTFSAGNGVNVRPHPHINLATVTYLFEGEILHRDSLGSLQTISPGDINLMIAGSGIVHSEREREQVRKKKHTLHGLQLWLALPEADEEVAPSFHHYPAERIPTLQIDGVNIRVMMGNAYGAMSPVKTLADTVYVEARMQAGQKITLPDADERGIYIVSGGLKAFDVDISQHEMGVFSNGTGVVLEATRDSLVAIIGGEKFSNRYVNWNFVSSRKSRLKQAREDWAAGRFPKVPGDEEEFIPLPE